MTSNAASPRLCPCTGCPGKAINTKLSTECPSPTTAGISMVFNNLAIELRGAWLSILFQPSSVTTSVGRHVREKVLHILRWLCSSCLPPLRSQDHRNLWSRVWNLHEIRQNLLQVFLTPDENYDSFATGQVDQPPFEAWTTQRKNISLIAELRFKRVSWSWAHGLLATLFPGGEQLAK